MESAPPAAQLELSVVIPSYQEAENLKNIIPQVKAALSATGIAYEVVIIDTMQPTDATEAVCREHAVRYLNRERGNRYGAAIRSGIRHAHGNYILIMDADGSHPPAFIPEMVALAGRYDLVIASRYVRGGTSHNDWSLVLMSRLLNGVVMALLGMPVRDASTSFRLYRGEYLRALELTCENFDVLQEILFKLIRRYPEIRMKEIPSMVEKRLYGKSKRNYVSFVLSYLVTLFRLRWMH